MSDLEALKIFSRQPVSNEMINFLAATTSSIIQIKCAKPQYSQLNNSTSNILISPVSKKSVSLVNFIKSLIKYSNVQTPTLMATLIYLNKLRNLLPANAIGMETTRHRIFLASLILSAKSLNDSSPLNKHWTKYTDGLLSIDEVNMAERELIGLLKWKITIKTDELITALQPFLTTIKESLARKQVDESIQKINYYRLSNLYSNRSLVSPSTPTSLVSSSTNSSISSLGSSHSIMSLNHSSSSQYSLNEDQEYDLGCKKQSSNYSNRLPLSSKSTNSLNIPRQTSHLKSQSQSQQHYYPQQHQNQNQNQPNSYYPIKHCDDSYYQSGVNLLNSGKIVT